MELIAQRTVILDSRTYLYILHLSQGENNRRSDVAVIFYNTDLFNTLTINFLMPICQMEKL